MKFCTYTNFDALFPSVVRDFQFLRLHQYFEIAKFVYFRKILTFQTPDNAFSSLFRREKSLTVIYHLLELTITVYTEHFLLETTLKQI